jgi:hypothetical protein
MTTSRNLNPLTGKKKSINLHNEHQSYGSVPSAAGQARVAGKIAVITGAASGIGKEIARIQAAVVGHERLHLLGAVRCEPVLRIDRRKQRRERRR